MPAQVGGVTSQQFAVYEEFARSVPGFLSTSQMQDPAVLIAKHVQAGTLQLPGVSTTRTHTHTRAHAQHASTSTTVVLLVCVNDGFQGAKANVLDR